MHDDFADWYRPCTTGTEVNLTGDLLEKRWAGVEIVTQDPGHDVLDMVRLALGRPAPEGFVAKFKAAFKAADITFPMSGNQFELSVLAGSATCWTFHEEAEEADEAALALLCAVSMVEPPVWSRPFVSHATAYLDKRLSELRKPSPVAKPRFVAKALKSAIEVHVARVAENNPPQTDDSLKQFGEALIQAFVGLADAVGSAIGQLDQMADHRREETDVLWWVTAAGSRDLGKTFKQLKTWPPHWWPARSWPIWSLLLAFSRPGRCCRA